MKLSMLAAANNFIPEANPTGQVFFQTNGTFQWVCPPGVTSVCLAMVSSGENGKNDKNSASNRKSGRGGNFRYTNNVPVVPGTTYEINIPSNNSAASAFGFNTDQPQSSTFIGANGSAGATGNRQISGGAAGGAAPGTNSYGFNLLTFKDNATLPTGHKNETLAPGCVAGGGGRTWYRSDIGFYGDTSGAPGAVRIIWGQDRSFPNQNIQDM